MKKLKYLVFSLFFLSLSCLKPNYPEYYPDAVEQFSDSENSYILQVPFIKQYAYTCGPAAVTEYLLYLGVTETLTGEKVSQEYLSNISNGWDGTTVSDLTALFYVCGCSVQIIDRPENLDLEMVMLRSSLKRKLPVIVLIRHDSGTPGIYRDHFMLVVGVTKDFIFVHNGSDPYAVIPKDKYWEDRLRHNTGTTMIAWKNNNAGTGTR